MARKTKSHRIHRNCYFAGWSGFPFVNCMNFNSKSYLEKVRGSDPACELYECRPARKKKKNRVTPRTLPASDLLQSDRTSE